MSLYDLGQQYAQEAKNVGDLLEAATQRREVAKKRKDTVNSQRLEKLIKHHKEQRDHLMRLSDELCSYYIKPEERVLAGGVA